MSYFDFDLQLFADPTPVSVELTTATKTDLQATPAETTTQLLGADGNLYADEAAVTAAGTTVAGKFVITVEGSNVTARTLTIVAAAGAEVTIKGASATELNGVNITTKASLTGEATPTTTVKFGDDSLNKVAVTGGSFAVSSSGVVVGQGVAVTVTKGDDTFIITETAEEKTITVSNAGVVSGLNAGDVFTVKEGTEDALPTTYTAAANSLAVTGDQVGIYTQYNNGSADTNIDIADVTVAVAAGKDTVEQTYTVDETKKTATVTGITVPGKFTPAAQETAGTKYYAVTVNEGTYTVAVSAAESAVSGAVGYFKVVTDTNYGEPTATISFVTHDFTENSTVADKDITLLGNVTIDAAKLDKVTVGTNPTGITQLIINTSSTGKVTVNNVTTTADVSITGDIKTYKADSVSGDESVVTYEKTYSLGTAKTIALSGLTDTNTDDSVATTYYFEIVTNDSQDHGKQVYSISTTKVTEANKDDAKSYFSVAVKGTEYTVDFAAGTGNAPASLKDADWAGIVIDAIGITTGSTIVVSGDETEGATDTYVVNNAAIGVVVAPVDGKLTAENINRAAGDVVTTLTISDGSDITLSKTDSTVQYNVVKTDPTHTGNQTLTVTKVSESVPLGANYITVTTAGGKCTVSYTGTISLSGLKDSSGNAIKIPLAVGTIDNTVEVVITDTTVDYSITYIPAGTVVTGIDSGDNVTWAEGLYNNVSLKLTELIAEDGTVNYAVTAGNKADNGYKTVTLGAKLESPEATDNYFTITKSGDTYTISYTKATSGDSIINLSTATGGATNIDADGLTALGTTIQIVNGTGEAQTVNAYTATNVVSGGYTSGGIKVGTIGESFTGDNLADTNITYKTSNAFTQSADIDLNETTKVYTVVAATSKGVTTYTIAAVDNVTAAGDNSYFQVTKNEDTKTATLAYKAGSGATAVTEAAFATVMSALGKQVTVNAIDNTTAETIVLTDDTENAISYNVTNIKAGVVVNNASDADTLTYVNKFVLAEGASTITLGTAASTVYYAVTAGDAVNGIYTCSIGTTALTEQPAATTNYFTVVTADGTATVTYHKGTGEGAVAYDLANNTVTIDATNAAETVNITAGSSGDDSDNIKYTASDLTKGQTLAVGVSSGAAINPAATYVTTYALKYNTEGSPAGITSGGLSLLASATGSEVLGKTYYYTVTKSETADNGEYTYTVKANTDINKKPTDAKAYFAVTYGSEYVTTITYVNVNGTSDYDLSGIGKQIAVDATNSTATTIDITDTQYTGSTVNYALTNVKSNVTVEGQSNGDTVAKVGGEVTLADSITLTEAEKAYYVVGADGKLTPSEDKPTTADNYITVTKTSNNYDIAYTQSSTSTAYTLAGAGKLTVNAKSAAAGTITKNIDATVAVINAAPATTGGNTISYRTGFAWAAGTYYVPVDNSAITLDASATGTSVATGTYAVVKVTYDSATKTYAISEVKAATTNNTTGVITPGSAYSGTVNLVAGSDAIKLNAANVTGTITGVAAKSELTNVASTVIVTTAELDKGEYVKIGDNTYTAGATSEVTVVGGKVTAGVLALSTTGDALTGATENKEVTLTESSDGVVVTFANGEVKSITGLATNDEKVTFGNATYIIKDNYIKKYVGGVSTWAVAPGTAGDVLSITEWYEGTATEPAAVQVGGFKWTAGTYIVKASETIKATDGTKSDIEANTTDKYAKIVLSADNTIGSITILQNNSYGLPTVVANATDTVSIEASSTAATTYAKASGATFHVTITGAITGSSFTNMKEGDTVTSAALTDDATVSINGVVYTATGQGTDVTQQLTFKDGALQTGTVKVVKGAVYALADGSTLTYTHDSGNAQIVMKDGKLESISNLGTDETVTITTATTTTVYTSNDTDGKTVTKTVTTRATGEKTTETITLENQNDDVLAGTKGTATYSYTNTLDWTKEYATYGYYKATANPATGMNAVNVAASGSGDMINGEFYIKAELTPVTKSDGTTFDHNKLTLTPGSIVGGVFTEDTTGILNGATVTVTVAASGNAINFTNNQGFNVEMTGVPANSDLTLKKGDTATTAALTSGTITINDNTYTAQNTSAAALTFYAKTASDVRLVGAGTVLVTGELSGMKNTSTEGSTVTYTAKTGVTSGNGADGVVVTYNDDGKVTAITDLEAGETVTTVTGGVTKTYTANSTAANIITVTVAGDSTAANNGTFVKDITTAGSNIVVDVTSSDKAVSNDYTFNWNGAKAATGTESAVPATGYFLVSAGKAVTVDGTKVTIDNTSYGQTVIKATLTAAGELSLTKATIGITGAITDTSDAITSTEATAVTLAITGSQMVSYAAPSGVALTVTGAGDGSVFTGVGDDDTITTAALNSGGTLKVGTHLFTAGVNSDTLVVTGDGKVVSGTFSLVTADSNAANTLTAYNKVTDVSELDADDVVSTSSDVTYTAGTGEDAAKNGANVVVENGLVKSITGMGDGEKVVIATTTTTKGNSTGSIVTTTYTSEKVNSVYTVTKTVKDAEGKTSVYTKNFANDAQDVINTAGWTTTKQTTTTVFDFGKTEKGSVGYFVAKSTAEGYVLDDNTNATITTQLSSTDIEGSSDTNRYYLKVVASQSVSGAITISSISLVHLESTGAWTESNKTVGTLALAVPDGATLALPEDRSYGLAMTSNGIADITNVSALDKVSGTQTTTGNSLKLNGTAYMAAANNNVFEINGDGSVTKGSFTVKDAALKAADSEDVVSYTKGSTDGVTVVFTDGKIASISDLDDGESVTVTSADGTKVTYAYDGSKTTKTVVSGGNTEVFTNTGTLTAAANVAGLVYVLPNTFDWGVTDGGNVGYYQYTTAIGAATFTVPVPAGKASVTPADSSTIARIEVSGDATNGYTIKSIKLYKDAAMTADTTSDPTFTLAAPGSLTLAADADRKYKLAITDAKSGQTFSGLSADDSVATGNLAAGSTITVNDVTYTNAVLGAMTVNGNGKAKAGQFALTSGKAINIQDGTDSIIVTTTKGNGATVTVANNKLTAITKMDNGDTVVVTTTSAAGVVTKVTYEAKTATDSEGGITITKTTVADGATTVATYTAENNGDNILSGEYSASASGNKIVSKLDWKATAGSTGYILAANATSSEDKVTGLGAVTVVAETKETPLTYKQAGNVYLKVSTTYDAESNTATITALQPYVMTSSGALSTDAIGDSATFAGTINITAPTGVALKLDTITTTPVPANVALNITEAAAGSDIVLHGNDTLTTATLKADKKVTVNGSEFTTGANGALKFTVKDTATKNTGAVLADGTVKVAAGGSFTAAGITTADGDDVTVNVTGSDAVVTVTNGVVTAISGQNTPTTDKVTVTTAGAESTVYTYDGTKYNAEVSGTVTGTVTLAALADGATITGLGGGYTSGADNNTIVLVSGQLKNGTVKAANNVTVTAIGATSSADDNIEVKYTGSGNAVITVANGQVTSIKGLGKSDKIVVTQKGAGYNQDGTTVADIVTTYTVDASGTYVEKSVKEGNKAEVETTAYISTGAELLTASYFGEDSSGLVGQFSWNPSIGRNVGYFDITEKSNGKKTANIGEQTKEETATATKNKTSQKYFVVTNNKGEISISAIQANYTAATANAAAKVDVTTLDVTDATEFSSADRLTVTADAAYPITYSKGAAQFALTFNKVGAKSVFTGLDTSDKVTTNTLDVGSIVTFDGVTYTAGAKKTLTFVGEGDSAGTHAVALLAGTVKITSADTKPIRLAGAKETEDNGSMTNDYLVTTTEADTEVLVTVANGDVTSIKGLTTKNATVTVTQGNSVTQYKVLNGDGTMIEKAVYTWADANSDGAVDAGELSGTTTQYLTVTKGGEVVSKNYQNAAIYKGNAFDYTAPERGTSTTYGYVLLGENVANLYDAKSIGAVGGGNTGNLIKEASFTPTPGNYYLRVTAATTAANVTTIKAVDLMQAGATGTLTPVKSTVKTYRGTLTIDGTKTAAVTGTLATYAVLNGSTLPAASKRDWKLAVTNAGLGSTFTNLGEGDAVSTADVTAATLKAGPTYLYNGVDTDNDGTKDYTEVRKITVKGDGVDVTVTDGDIATLTGLTTKNESVTIEETTIAGIVTTSYVVDRTGTTVTMTKTNADGAVTVKSATVAAIGDTSLTDYDWTNATAVSTTYAVESTFDWTTDKNTTGYFAVTTSRGVTSATVKGTTITKIRATTAATVPYIAVELDKESGKVETIKQVSLQDGTMQAYVATPFSGTINITAPTAAKLTLDRATSITDGTIAETANLAITGAITGSDISNLANKDTVTTAKLVKGEGTVTVNDATYTAGVTGSLRFKVQDGTVALVSGTALLTTSGATDTIGKDMLSISDGTTTKFIKALTGNITVQVTKVDAKTGATTFTIGDLADGESFSVGETTYLKSASTLFKQENGTITAVYALTKNTVASSVLSGTSGWTAVTAAFDEDGNSKIGTITVNLASVDSRYRTDTKNKVTVAGNDYNLVVDTSVRSASRTPNTTAAAIVDATAGWQTEVGTAANVNADNKTYTANADIAQTITAAAGWTVKGSDKADIITSATSGKVYINGGVGDDKITLKGAAEEVTVALDEDGLDKVSGYNAGDTIKLTSGGNSSDDFAVQLGGKGEYGSVYLFSDDGNNTYEAGENGVQLMSVNGKAVTINGKTYYFGTEAKNPAAGKFTYAEGDYYYGNSSGKNTLTVGTDKTKAADKILGDDVVVDLTATDGNGRNFYNNIQNVNAASSTNRVVLTAAATGSSLTGGKYQSTLKSGSGNDTLTGGTGKDMFWFDDVNGNDTVSKYTSVKDAVYVGGTSDLTKGYTVSANGSNVVIKKDGDATSGITITGAVNAAKAVTISTDGKIDGSYVDYYVGKATTANKFTKFDGDAYYVGGANNDTIQLAKGDLGAAVDMTTSKYQSIEIIDATALKGKNATAGTTAGVTVTTGTSDVTVKGSIYADTVNISGAGNATINYAKAANANGDTITGFGVDDVIQINGLKDVTWSQTTEQEANNIYTVTGNGLSMTITVEAGKTLSKKTVSNKNVQITAVAAN